MCVCVCVCVYQILRVVEKLTRTLFWGDGKNSMSKTTTVRGKVKTEMSTRIFVKKKAKKQVKNICWYKPFFPFLFPFFSSFFFFFFFLSSFSFLNRAKSIDVFLAQTWFQPTTMFFGETAMISWVGWIVLGLKSLEGFLYSQKWMGWVLFRNEVP